LTISRGGFAQERREFGHGAFVTKKQEVGDKRLLVGHVGKTVHALFFRDAVVVASGDFIEHFEQTAVEERNALVEFFDGSFLVKQPDVAEVALVAVVLVLALIGAGGTELSFIGRRVEGCEEQVLEDGLVVATLLVRQRGLVFGNEGGGT
jgi:hypothetical protein